MSAAQAIRLAVPGDEHALSALAIKTFVDTFGHLYPPDDLRGYLAEVYPPPVILGLIENPHHRLWVSEAAGSLTGYAQAGSCKLPHPEARPTHGELMRLYVLNEQRGTGLAHALMKTALTWMEQEHEGPLWVGVYSDNLRAQRFYVRYHFVPVGEYAFPVGKTRDREFILRRDERRQRLPAASGSVQKSHSGSSLTGD